MAIKIIFLFYFKIWKERTIFTEEVADLRNTFFNPIVFNNSVTIDTNVCIVPY